VIDFIASNFKKKEEKKINVENMLYFPRIEYSKMHLNKLLVMYWKFFPGIWEFIKIIVVY